MESTTKDLGLVRTDELLHFAKRVLDMNDDHYVKLFGRMVRRVLSAEPILRLAAALPKPREKAVKAKNDPHVRMMEQIALEMAAMRIFAKYRLKCPFPSILERLRVCTVQPKMFCRAVEQYHEGLEAAARTFPESDRPSYPPPPSVPFPRPNVLH
jgi:hypothetical protein